MRSRSSERSLHPLTVTIIRTMVWLDCSDVDSAVACLADAIGIDDSQLRNAVLAYDESRFSDYSEDQYKRMPREILERSGGAAEVPRFDGVYYFHGSRLIGLEDIRVEGILPLDQMVDRIWEMLFLLVCDECDPAEWNDFRQAVEAGGGGHDGSLYRSKSRYSLHHGPYAVLVPETFLMVATAGIHDYLDCPEIVQDIARCFLSHSGIDVETRFREASRPVIVKFRSTTMWEGTFRAALWYVFSMLRDGEVSSNANEGFDGHGKPIPAAHIVGIEVVG
jgi:hypothetical protein